MASPQNNKPIELLFKKSVRMRGEHLIGMDQTLPSGGVNMIEVKRGEKRPVDRAAAVDLIIAEQAIDFRKSTPEQIEEAQEIIKQDADRARRNAMAKVTEIDATATGARKKVA